MLLSMKSRFQYYYVFKQVPKLAARKWHSNCNNNYIRLNITFESHQKKTTCMLRVLWWSRLRWIELSYEAMLRSRVSNSSFGYGMFRSSSKLSSTSSTIMFIFNFVKVDNLRSGLERRFYIVNFLRNSITEAKSSIQSEHFLSLPIC